MSNDFSFTSEPARRPAPRLKPPRSNRWPWLVGGLLTTIAVAGVATAILVSRPSTLSHEKPGQSGLIGTEPQNHAELLEYLNKRGANVRIEGGGEVFGRPTSYFRDKDAKVEELSDANYVIVVLHPDKKSAADAAAAGGDAAFAWNRFCFEKRTDAAFFDRIRKALK